MPLASHEQCMLNIYVRSVWVGCMGDRRPQANRSVNCMVGKQCEPIAGARPYMRTPAESLSECNAYSQQCTHTCVHVVVFSKLRLYSCMSSSCNQSVNATPCACIHSLCLHAIVCSLTRVHNAMACIVGGLCACMCPRVSLYLLALLYMNLAVLQQLSTHHPVPSRGVGPLC